MLIPFPIAFFTGTLIFDVLGWIFTNTDFWITGNYMEIAGVLISFFTAIPGFIDYLYTVPPKSSGKDRAAKHGILNVSMVIIFAFAFYYRQGLEPSPFIIVGLEIIGFVMLIIAAWMGGTLAYRNQIGVDIRYAGAGKWKETFFSEVNENIAVASATELEINQMKLLHVKDKRIVLGRTEKGFVAFDDHCPHRGGSLAGGALMCGQVQCPWHGSQFDVETGKVNIGPAKDNIKTYPLTEREGKIYLQNIS